VRASRSFARDIGALEQVFDFTAEVLQPAVVPPALHRSVDFVLEEFFTNIVKYGARHGYVGIEIALSDTDVAIAVTEPDADFFDVTQAPAADTTLPIEQRQPGGLGLHLVRRLVDTLRYEYRSEDRCGRIAFTFSIEPGDETSKTVRGA
jgi:anti-sigma regulatory factor (Ser/Thr protein kinase)